MVDFNQGLQLGEALERCHAIDDLGLTWIEEPIVYDNLEGYARLTADLKTPVQIGENFYGPRALYTALQMKACDYVMPDFMRIGGVTGWQRAAAIAAAAGIPISTHLYPEVAAHVMRVTEPAHWLEWQDWANPIFSSPTRSRMASCIFRTCRASGWSGTRRRLPPTWLTTSNR
jgi:mandelate racemase